MTRKILALDTATENCSVALKINDEIIARCENAPRDHTIKILPMVDEVLAEAGIKLNQLDALAFGRGPGSFTGVRIGIGIAQGLAFGSDLPMIGISTLAAMAQQAYRLHQADFVLSAIDARMNEIYLGGYRRLENGDWQNQIAEQVISPELLELHKNENWFIAGTGWQAYPNLKEKFSDCIVESQVLFPEAEDMLLLADFAFKRGELVSAENASPVYLRDTVTWKKLPGRE